MTKLTLTKIVALALVISSCNNSNFKGYEMAENGLHYHFFNQDKDGAKVQIGDGVILHYAFYRQDNDSLIGDSKESSKDGSGYVQFGVSPSTFKGSFEDGLLMMSKGDSAAFIVSADSFFLKTNHMTELPKGIKPGSFLKGIFALKEIRTKKELEENQKKQMAEQEKLMIKYKGMEAPLMERFLKEYKINAKPTSSGLYYIEIKKGTGAFPKSTDIVKVHYTGKFLDGKTFDSSIERGEPIEFPLNQVIKGWTEGLQLMKKGGKAKLILPSSIAYGPNGNEAIHPYAPLTFDVELIDFKAAPTQTAMPKPEEKHNPNDGHSH